MAKSNNFLRPIDHLRVIAMSFVVASHILYAWGDEPNAAYINAFIKHGTVMFVFIAGYLFQHLAGKFEYKTYLTKRLRSVLLPYLVVSAPMIVVRIMFSLEPNMQVQYAENFDNWPMWQQAGYMILTGSHLLPLWFIPTIWIYYLLAPVFIKGDQTRLIYKLLPIFIILSLFVPRVWLDNLPRMFVHFLSVYVLGMLCSRYKEEFLQITAKYHVLLIILAVVSSVLVVYTVGNEQLLFVQKMLFCWLFFYWLWIFDNKIPVFVGTLGDISFGVYLVHFYFIMGIRHALVNVVHLNIANAYLYWTVHFIIVMVAVCVFLLIYRKITPKLSKLTVGC